MELSSFEIGLRLVAAMLLSGVIGMERQFRQKPAGFRTNGLVGLGAAVMTIAGILAAQQTTGVDTTRIASIVVQGIGFLGAGAIIQSAGSIRGLTTAATLWVVAGIGIACGFGFWLPAVITTVLVFMLLVVFGPLDAKLDEEGEKGTNLFRKK